MIHSGPSGTRSWGCHHFLLAELALQRDDLMP